MPPAFERSKNGNCFKVNDLSMDPYQIHNVRRVASPAERDEILMKNICSAPVGTSYSLFRVHWVLPQLNISYVLMGRLSNMFL